MEEILPIYYSSTRNSLQEYYKHYTYTRSQEYERKIAYYCDKHLHGHLYTRIEQNYNVLFHSFSEGEACRVQDMLLVEDAVRYLPGDAECERCLERLLKRLGPGPGQAPASCHCKYLYIFKQWLPESATMTCPSAEISNPCGPYRGSPAVWMYDRKDPELSNTYRKKNL